FDRDCSRNSKRTQRPPSQKSRKAKKHSFFAGKDSYFGRRRDRLELNYIEVGPGTQVRRMAQEAHRLLPTFAIGKNRYAPEQTGLGRAFDRIVNFKRPAKVIRVYDQLLRRVHRGSRAFASRISPSRSVYRQLPLVAKASISPAFGDNKRAGTHGCQSLV